MLITKSFLWQFQINCRSKHWFPFPVQFRLAESEWIIEWFETINICLHFGTVKWRCFERSGGACEKGKKKKNPTEWHQHRCVVALFGAPQPRLLACEIIRQPGCALARIGLLGQQVHRRWSLPTSLSDDARTASHVGLRRSSLFAPRTFARFYILIPSSRKNAFPSSQPPPANLVSWQGAVREKESQRRASSAWAHQQTPQGQSWIRQGEAGCFLDLCEFKEFGAKTPTRGEKKPHSGGGCRAWDPGKMLLAGGA